VVVVDDNCEYRFREKEGEESTLSMQLWHDIKPRNDEADRREPKTLKDKTIRQSTNNGRKTRKRKTPRVCLIITHCNAHHNLLKKHIKNNKRKSFVKVPN